MHELNQRPRERFKLLSAVQLFEKLIARFEVGHIVMEIQFQTLYFQRRSGENFGVTNIYIWIHLWLPYDPKKTWLGFVFVVINPCVLSVNRVDLGFFCLNFPILPPPPPTTISSRKATPSQTLSMNIFKIYLNRVLYYKTICLGEGGLVFISYKRDGVDGFGQWWCGRLRPDPISLISVMVWTASARYYHPISLISVMLWKASARYILI